MKTLPCYLDLGDGGALIPCRDKLQALLLGRLDCDHHESSAERFGLRSESTTRSAAISRPSIRIDEKSNIPVPD